MKIKYVYLTAARPAELASFYGGLGLPTKFADGERWIQFASEGSAFCIAGREESAAAPSSNAVAVFEVGSLEAMLGRALKGGAEIVRPTRDMGDHGRVAQIRDPEGNIVQFFESNRQTI